MLKLLKWVLGIGLALALGVIVITLFAAQQVAAFQCLSGDINSSTQAAAIDFDGDKILVNGEPLDPEQQEIAGMIVAMAQERGHSEQLTVTHLQTAYQESRIRNLKDGDGTSVGVYQQIDNGAWGTYEQRIHPPTAIKNYLDAVEAVPGYETMSPWELIVNHVQRPSAAAYRSSENNFEGWRPLAQAIYDQIEGRPVVVGEMSVVDWCGSAGTGQISLKNGVAFPVSVDYTISSAFGNRWHPVRGGWSLHDGVDLTGMPEGTPTFSVLDGEVIRAGLAGGYGNYVVVRLADGTEIGYAHLKFISVNVGDIIPAGTQIGGIGGAKGDPGAGTSTGVHLHFNVKLPNGEWTEPLTWLSDLQKRADAEAQESPEVLAGSSVTH